jgi:hypothetical protein
VNTLELELKFSDKSKDDIFINRWRFPGIGHAKGGADAGDDSDRAKHLVIFSACT